MKRNIIFAIATALVAALTTSCSSDDITGGAANAEQDSAVPIQLGFGIPKTRATATAEDTEVAQGQQIAVFCDTTQHTMYSWNETVLADEYFGAWIFTGEAGGTVTSTGTHSYPHAQLHIDLYAMTYPGGDKDGHFFDRDAKWPGTLTLKTVTDQSTDSAVNSADLLYGTLTDVPQQKNRVTINLYHMFSKVQVMFVPGDGFTYSDISDCTVKLLNAPAKCTFNPGKVDATSLARRPARAGMYQYNNNEDGVTDITLASAVYHNLEQTDAKFTDVIVPMKTYAAGEKMFSLTINKGKYAGMTLYYVLPSQLTLQTGYSYNFKITVYPDRLSGNYVLEPWEAASGDPEYLDV